MLLGFVGMADDGPLAEQGDGVGELPGLAAAGADARRRSGSSARIVGLIAGIGLVAAIVNRVRADLGLAVAGFSFLVAFADLRASAWVLLSLLLPRATTDPGRPAARRRARRRDARRACRRSASCTCRTASTGPRELYGAIGTTIVTLGWFFILGRAIVLAMAVNAVIYERFGSISQFVFALPVLRPLPRRFGVDPPLLRPRPQ